MRTSILPRLGALALMACVAVAALPAAAAAATITVASAVVGASLVDRAALVELFYPLHQAATRYMLRTGMMMAFGPEVSAETIALMKTAQGSPVDDPLLKQFVQPGSATTGLQLYNLEAPAKNLFPILTPLRNQIPRVGGGFAIQANWKAITNINVGNTRAGLSEGKRGGVINYAQSEYFAAFRGFGLENYVTFEAQWAGKGFDDIKALSVSQLLSATMIQEERLILGGNGTLALGTTPTPTLSTATTGGTMVAQTQSVICIALGLQAYLDLAGANNGAIGQQFNATTSALSGQITRTNADGTTDTFGDGSAQKSAAATIVTTGATSTVTASVSVVNGAVGYAWYVGVAGSERLYGVTTINSIIMTAQANGGAQLASAVANSDNSTSALDFDGLLTQTFKPGSNAYVGVQANGTLGTGTGFTSDGAGGVFEFEAAFVNFYNKYRLSPSVCYVHPQELVNLSKKIIGNSGAPLLRLTDAASDFTNIMGGAVVGSYMNKVTGTVVPIVVHPNMPPGTVFFFTRNLPYPLSGVTDPMRMLMRQDYYQIEWPLKSRKYEYFVGADGVLQHFAPFSMGVITNIGNV